MEGIEVILKYITGFAIAAFWWLINRIFKRVDVLESNIKRLDQKLTDTELQLAKDYITKDDLEKLEKKIIGELNRIHDKLDK